MLAEELCDASAPEILFEEGAAPSRRRCDGEGSPERVVEFGLAGDGLGELRPHGVALAVSEVAAACAWPAALGYGRRE